MRDITNSDYRVYSAHLGVLVIFQINTFQVTKFMCNYRYQLWCSMFLNQFATSSQIIKLSYGTRTASNYRSHSCRSNLKQFTILYLGPKLFNSLLATIACLQSFSSFKKKLLEFVLKSS